MDRHTPPSPAPTRVDPLPSGFNELLQHNASYSHEAISADPIQAHSQPGSSSYGPIPEPYSTPATSPPTPSRGSDVISTRSSARGDGGARALGPRSTRIEKSTPKKKKDRAKAPKNMPVIDRPMSELTRGSSIAIADIETYVHRSSEVRRQEIETGKNPGRIKRPMNAFMLYRKAYQQRAKEWASQHNHQIVSRVCGMSWPLEPEHIRLQFKAWADTERDNHQKAHPNYKFTPAKPQKPSKYEGGYDERSDGSDLEDYNWVGRGGSRIRSATHTPGADSDYIPSRSVYVATHPHPNQLRGLHPMGMMHQTRSTALDFHSGKPLPGPYEYRGFQAQYFEPHMRNQQRHLHHGADDVAMHSTPSPSSVFQQSHYDLSQQYHPKVEQQQIQHQSQSHQHQQHHQFEHRIDPSLVPQDDGLFDPGSFNTVPSMFDGSLSATQQTWHTSQSAAAGEGESQFSNALMGLDDPLSFEQQAQYMGGEWQVEPLTETAHFDTNWVDPKTEP
ncbi:hypothetical protein CHGG_02745 [Chaetomium globosum CBS 148.51]|uniref:HMG box domain-containing protein n=1 Tax=Chaetomium globosum (strain ATCC 6205 / CBS 148.51 / DSM 1962 / NBRC 6347 / NRRL 1970) TaxID=306901 RepID=Q2HAK9_CHAGB|nr:uncharacterized protein CHGG_02745 [Chaetomium globosum CBS 148.51]EAQ90810.1 hypothetical protein CHGG_02745 [Chaetomium globosum CBS 148.51]